MPQVKFNPAQRETVLQEYRTAGRLKAVIAVRQATGADLKGAIELLDAAIAGAGVVDRYAEDDSMGMNADVLAIGPYSVAVKDHMEYPAKFYTETRDGAPILQELFHVYEGSTRSRELAECFGIEPWDFNKHELDAARANVPKLREMFGQEEVAKFEALRGEGFKFYFRPNG